MLIRMARFATAKKKLLDYGYGSFVLLLAAATFT